MQVIPLNGKMEDPKMQRIALDRAGNGQADRRKDVLTSKRPKRRAKRDV
jgi:hypothetical protein